MKMKVKIKLWQDAVSWYFYTRKIERNKRLADPEYEYISKFRFFKDRISNQTDKAWVHIKFFTQKSSFRLKQLTQLVEFGLAVIGLVTLLNRKQNNVSPSVDFGSNRPRIERPAYNYSLIGQKSLEKLKTETKIQNNQLIMDKNQKLNREFAVVSKKQANKCTVISKKFEDSQRKNFKLKNQLKQTLNETRALKRYLTEIKKIQKVQENKILHCSRYYNDLSSNVSKLENQLEKLLVESKYAKARLKNRVLAAQDKFIAQKGKEKLLKYEYKTNIFNIRQDLKKSLDLEKRLTEQVKSEKQKLIQMSRYIRRIENLYNINLTQLRDYEENIEISSKNITELKSNEKVKNQIHGKNQRGNNTLKNASYNI